MKTIKYSKLILKTTILTSIGYSCFAQTSDTSVVNFNETYQVIDGFGAASVSGLYGPDTMTNALADMFFSPTKGIGLSLMRNQIMPDGATKEISMMRQAQARGAKVWSTPWSPPSVWKSNDDSINGGYLLPQYYPNYAGQFARYVANMKDSGVNIYAVSIQNEPNQSASYESCLWDDSEMHAFIPFLYDSLQSRKLGTKILADEESCWYLSYVGEIMSDSVTNPMLGICAAHDYCYADPPTPLSTDGKHEWETEVCTLDNLDSSIANGLYWANNISQFMTVANANAWHYWWLICHNEVNNEGLVDSLLHPAKRMYVLGNFSKFVRPGSYRVGTTGGPGGVVVSAYKDTATGAFAIVVINNNDSNTSFTATLSGLPAPSVTSWITSATLSLIQQPDVTVSDSSFSYILPDSSITTFVYTGISTGVNAVSNSNNNILVYPNPAQNEITISGLDVSQKNEIVCVYSSLGQLVYENTISGTERYTLNVTGFASGMYCVVISNTKGQVAKKVMILK